MSEISTMMQSLNLDQSTPTKHYTTPSKLLHMDASDYTKRFNAQASLRKQHLPDYRRDVDYSALEEVRRKLNFDSDDKTDCFMAYISRSELMDLP